MVEIWDIGNTHIRIAVWDGGEFIGLRRLPVSEIPEISGDRRRICACVNPAVKAAVPVDSMHFISAADPGLPVDFSLVDTSTLGADRVANAIAAAAMYSLPAVVIDCGTALTMEVVDSERRFVGGAIAPGRKLLRQILARGTAQLPEIPLSSVKPEAIGQNTRDAIHFGVDHALIGTVREWLNFLRQKYPDITVILTGGDAGFLSHDFPEAVIADEFFTLHGIRLAGGY